MKQNQKVRMWLLALIGFLPIASIWAEDVVVVGKAAVAKLGETEFSYLQDAVDAAQTAGGSQTIYLVGESSDGETVNIKQVANFKLTIDGKKDESSNYKTDAQFVIDGLRGNGGSNTNGASVTLKNIAFVNNAAKDVINPAHYPHHLTIQDCTYTGSTTSKNNWFINVTDGPLYGATIKNITIESSRLIQGNLGLDVVFENITATNNITAGFNIKTESSVLIKNCKVTTAKYAFRDYQDDYVGTITLEDNTFISTSNGSDEGAIVNRGGKVGTAHINVVSGTYTGKVVVLNNKEGVLSISGGKFKPLTTDEFNVIDGALVANKVLHYNTSDGTWTVGDGKYVAQLAAGFKYDSFAAAAAAANGGVITLLDNISEPYTMTEDETLKVAKGSYSLTVNAPEGFKVVPTVGDDGVTTYTIAVLVFVAQIGDVQYETLAKAIDAVPTDGTETTITMIDDETIVGNAGIIIPIGKNIILDLNGKTVTLSVTESKGSQLITNRGTLTITDSSEGQTGKLTNVADESLAVGSWPTNNYVTNVITNSGTLNVEGGTIQNTANGSICYAIDNNSTSYDAILNINGGYLTSVGTVIRQFCNSTTKQNVINMTGGVVTTNGYAAIWTQLPGSNASSKKLATLNISGGEITASSYAWYDYSYGDSFEAVNYSISGGKFTGYIWCYAVYNGVIDGFITGGTFSEEPTYSYIAKGYMAVPLDEGGWIVKGGVAEIYYSWYEEGILVGENLMFPDPFEKNYLCDGEFIELLKDVSLMDDVACLLEPEDGEEAVSFTLTFGDYTVTKGDYSVSLKNGVTVLTDKETDIFSAADPENYHIVMTESNGVYSYTTALIPDITVTITGHTGTYLYSNSVWTVWGYDVEISDPQYTVDDFTAPKQEEIIAQGKEEGRHKMNLKSSQFKNKKPEDFKVDFVIKNGWLQIDYANTKLVDDADNSTNILDATRYYGAITNVTLTGRTFKKNDTWNTICLPFDVTIADSPLKGADVREFIGATFEDNKVTLSFSESSLTEMKAGNPYIIKWEEGEDLSEPTFEAAKFNTELEDQVIEKTFEVGEGQSITFKGTYVPMKYDEADDNTVLLVGKGNTLFYPLKGASLNALRAYFKLEGLYAISKETASEAPVFVLSFGNATNVNNVSVDNMSNDYFDLSGRRVIGQPTEKGIYILNGKKVVVK